MKIGKDYQREVQRIRDEILAKKIKVETIKPNNHACYFCGKSIEEQTIKLTEKDQKGENTYFLGMDCFTASRLNKYIGNQPFSLS